jgi:hypothetical protein
LTKHTVGKKLLMSARGATALTLVLACLAAGCGATDRDSDAAASVERFQTGLQARDGAAACAELSPETSDALEEQEGKPCEEAIFALELPRGGRVAGTHVDVTSASVTLAAGGTLFLDEGPDGWEIAAAGCRPVTPSLPLDCELED